MLEIALHTGAEHPALLWIAVPSLLAFAAGVLVGVLGGSDDSEPEPDASTANRVGGQ